MPHAGLRKVSMGRPITAPSLIPAVHKATPACINVPLKLDGGYVKVTALSFCTPHGIVFAQDVDDLDVGRMGAQLGTDAFFPQGASIVFAQMLDGENLKARLWQRGGSEASFTPEAACAAVVAAIMLQMTKAHGAHVAMGQRKCLVTWDMGADNVYMTEPADLR